MKKVKNLYQQDRRYVFRIDVPPPLRDRMGKRSVKLQLGRDLDKATLLADEYRASYKSLFYKKDSVLITASTTSERLNTGRPRGQKHISYRYIKPLN